VKFKGRLETLYEPSVALAESSLSGGRLLGFVLKERSFVRCAPQETGKGWRSKEPTDERLPKGQLPERQRKLNNTIIEVYE
jgi:hypothetical protein